MGSPKVSVVLPVYNVEPYIQETIASILNQTFTDFELLVVDDLSTDGTAAIVAGIKDDRIILIRNTQNLGRAGADNIALKYVRGEFIAKMDGDDLCHPERLARQVAFLDSHPAVNVVGCWLQNFGASTYLHQYPVSPADLKVKTLFTLPGGNNCFMLRTSLFQEAGMHYNAALRQTEDYEFCVRYLDELIIATIPEALVQYRVLPRVVKQEILAERARVSGRVQELIFSSWGLAISAREQHIHSTLSLLDTPLGDISLSEIEAWLRRLLAHNTQNPRFDAAALRGGLGERWFEVCYAHPLGWLGSIRAYGRSPLAAGFSPTFSQRLKFWIKGSQHLLRSSTLARLSS